MSSRLLVRPKPYKDECILGYLLRICEKNGLRSMSRLLALVGLTPQNTRPPVLPLATGNSEITKLSQLLDMDITRLLDLCWLNRGDGVYARQDIQLKLSFLELTLQTFALIAWMNMAIFLFIGL